MWDGDIDAESPEKLDNIIDTTPVWKPVVGTMCNLELVGRLAINVIRKKDINKESLLKLDYPSRLWMKREIKNAANATQSNVIELLQLASEIPFAQKWNFSC